MTIRNPRHTVPWNYRWSKNDLKGAHYMTFGELFLKFGGQRQRSPKKANSINDVKNFGGF